MTAIWGPLGWMTLHSVSTIYPEHPSVSEQQLMTNWLDMYRDTITCSHCKEHFTIMLQNYRMRFPNMMQSRQEFAMFVFRAHNAVNARLSKPIHDTLDKCMELLKTNSKLRNPIDYRISYINHIQRHWKTLQDISGIVALRKVIEMKKIEVDYFTPRDNKFDVLLKPDTVVIPRSWVEAPGSQTQSASVPRIQTSSSRVGIQIIGGRIRLR